MPSKNIRIPLEPGKCYHIFNRGNDKIPIFYKRWHYSLFLGFFRDQMKSVADIYAFALLPNHFHFLIQVMENITTSPSNNIRRALIQYVTVINKMEKRTGSLFTKPFRRIAVESEDYLKALIFYIHYNPEKHKITDNFKDYRHTSFLWYESPGSNIIAEPFINKLFDGKEGYLAFHNDLHEEKKLRQLILED